MHPFEAMLTEIRADRRTAALDWFDEVMDSLGDEQMTYLAVTDWDVPAGPIRAVEMQLPNGHRHVLITPLEG